MLTKDDVTDRDYEVIKAYSASARTSRKSYALESSQLIVHLAINKARRAKWK